MIDCCISISKLEDWLMLWELDVDLYRYDGWNGVKRLYI